MHIHLMKNFNRFLFAFFQATETMEDLKRKIQSHEKIPIDSQIIYFGNKSLSRTCPQCKTADNRTLGEFEEFRAAFGHSEKLIMPSGYKNKDKFKVSAPWPQIYVKSKGANLSPVTVRATNGITLKINIKVNQTTNLIRIYF